MCTIELNRLLNKTEKPKITENNKGATELKQNKKPNQNPPTNQQLYIPLF